MDKPNDIAARALSTRFTLGVRLALDGTAWAFRRKELRALSFLSVAVNLLLYVGLLVLGFLYLNDVATWLAPDPARWQGFWRDVAELAQGIVKFLLGIAWVLLSVFLALAVGNVVSSPVFDLLSEKTEEILVGRSLAPPFSLPGVVRTSLRELVVQMALLVVYLPVVIAILLIGLLPGLGQLLAPLLTWVWTSMWITMTFTTQATARHGLGVKDRLRMLTAHKTLSLGFGAIESLLPFLLVPLFSPGLVVGGTRLFLSLAAYDRIDSKLTAEDKARMRGHSAQVVR